MTRLEEASEYYKGEHSEGIYPISSVDGQIIQNLLKLLKRASVDGRIIEAVADWKQIEDGDVLNEIIKLQDEKFDTTIYVEVSGNTVDLKHVQVISFEETVRTLSISGGTKKVYFMVLNPQGKVSPQAKIQDIRIEFETEMSREFSYSKLSKIAKEKLGLEFIKIS